MTQSKHPHSSQLIEQKSRDNRGLRKAIAISSLSSQLPESEIKVHSSSRRISLHQAKNRALKRAEWRRISATTLPRSRRLALQKLQTKHRHFQYRYAEYGNQPFDFVLTLQQSPFGCRGRVAGNDRARTPMLPANPCLACALVACRHGMLSAHGLLQGVLRFISKVQRTDVENIRTEKEE
jgi:hypothetical protein